MLLSSDFGVDRLVMSMCRVISWIVGKGCLLSPAWWLRGSSVCLQCGRPGFDPWVRKIPWRREWLPTPVFLPGESHGWRSLVGCRLWGRTESDTTEATSQQQQTYLRASPVAQMVKSLPATWETGVPSLGREDPLEKEMATPIPVLLPGKSRGQRCLVGYSPWGRKESTRLSN